MNSSPPLVIHLVISLAPGGLERLVVDWTNARNRRSPGSTRICCLDEPGMLAGQVQGEPVVCVNARRARWPFDLAAVRRLRNVFDGLVAGGGRAIPCGQSPMVLHAHNLAAWQYAVIAKAMGLFPPRRAGCFSPRLIYTQHGANIHNLNLRDRLRARILACFTDEIIAVSDATAEIMAAKLWIPRRRIRVVMNGVEGGGAIGDRPAVWGGCPHPLQDFGEARRMGTSAPHQQQADGDIRPTLKDETAPDKVIGTVGRLAQVKGQDRLIAAVASCQSENKPFSLLLLVGDGPEREELERQASGLGIADRVIFVGYQANPAPYLARMDLFVLPSRSEGVSIALLEAMAAGVPVAVTDVGANREILEDGKCGVILPDDERDWGGVFTDILQNEAATAARARAARERVRLHYSLTATLDNYEKLYCKEKI